MATLIQVAAPDGGDPLTVYGAKGVGTPSLRRDRLQVPQPTPVPDFPTEAKFINGNRPTSVRTPNSNLGMGVRIAAATETDLDLIVAMWRLVLAQLEYPVAITLGGRRTTWAGLPGTIVLTDGSRRELLPGQTVVDYFTITIPVLPDPLEVVTL